GMHGECRGTDGSPRIHAALAARCLQAGRKRVARLMRIVGVQGVSRRTPCRTTVRDETARSAPDLVDRQFTATGPDRLWVADITYVPHVGRLPVSRRRARCVESPCDRLGH